jgi:hypothetical protein
MVRLDGFDAHVAFAGQGEPDHNIALDSGERAINVNSLVLAVCGGNSKTCGACPDGTGDLAGSQCET